MKSKFLVIFLLLISITYSYSQEHNVTEAAQPQGKTIVFRFVADNDTFFIPYQGNGDKLDELVATIDHYKSVIANGQATINVPLMPQLKRTCTRQRSVPTVLNPS